MGITRISRLRDCGVFRDFTWPNDLATFGRYNLIYGWNWSGKTTLSRLFRALETRTAPTNGQITLSVNGCDVTGDDFAQATISVRVFNRDFMTESVFPVSGGDVPPIFVVGKESVEKQKEVVHLKTDLAQAQTKFASARSKKEEANKTLDKFCIDRARVIKDTLRSPGENPYNNYDKSDFRKRTEKMANDGDKETHSLSESDRDRLLSQNKATPKSRILEVPYRQPQLKELATSASELLSTTIVSKAIHSLKDDPELSAWVHKGLGLHQDRDADRCLFCELPLPKGRLTALETHFSTEYEQFLKMLDAQIGQLEAASRAAATLALPRRAELYEDLGKEYEAAETSLRRALDSTRDFLDALVQALTGKKGLVFKQLSLGVTIPEVDSRAMEGVNEVIRKHNLACDKFEARVGEARRRLEADFVAGDLHELVRLYSAVRKSEASVNEVDTQVKCLNREIERLEREIVGYRQPAEELNEDLRKYLGHDELHLDIKDTGYTITRNGVPAQALSEGETTAIALLYFLKSLQDRRFNLTNGVVVLDDPVSSLDANALYLAFGFIRERTQDAAQLFILTHNFTFFRQVRNWFRHLKGQNKENINQRPARFYMLDCAHDGSQRCSSIRALAPLLEQYDSEYHYLFARIYREAKVTTQGGLEENYIFPNMARRLLEAFLAFRQPQVKGDLWKKLQAVQFDEPRKIRILRFVHTHSHSGAVGEPEHDPSLLSEARAVVNDLLDLIQSQDAAHFSAMEQLVTTPTDEGGDE
jgi:wobble nucleotide-excising tRNase